MAQAAPPAYFTAGDAVALEDGRNLLVDHNGGVLHDPGTGTYTAVAGLPSGVDHMRACRLADGTVLVAGGVYSASCYRFDPDTGGVTATGALPQATWEAALHPLRDGGAVLLGGYPDNGVIYRYRAGAWSVPTARLPVPRQNPGCASFADGAVLLVGGGPSPATASLLAF